jgi:hypothetical protein
MTTLHTFGCSITQGFALPDVVKPVCDSQGQPLTSEQIQQQGLVVRWEDFHLYAASQLAWPQVLADRLNIPVINHARRGACFQQIARQCAVASIQSSDIVVVMWTYLSRISFQWPARTSVPLANIVDTGSWRTKILPQFNRFFGLSDSDATTTVADQRIYEYIQQSAAQTYLDPMGVYDQYYRNLVLQTMTAGFLAHTGARVIHLSVEPESYIDQLESARHQLDPSLREPYRIPDPRDWYDVDVDHTSCRVIHDPTIPPAENDMHPSVQHHQQFAQHIHSRYFS